MSEKLRSLASRIRRVVEQFDGPRSIDIRSDGPDAVEAAIRLDTPHGPNTIRLRTWGEGTVEISFTVDERIAGHLIHAYDQS